MIQLPPSTRIYLACGATDMRKGFDGLAVLVQQVLEQSPHSGAPFAFRGRRGDLVKLLWYGRKRWDALTRFLDEGTAEIDNNIAERAIRGIAVGRKNWLFAGPRAGGEHAAAIYSVIETCKLNCAEPRAYIADVIEKIAGNWPASRWDELMPWNWAAPDQDIRQAA